jgi:heat shock protein HtpX
MAFEDEIARNKRATALVVLLMFALLWAVIQAVAFAIGLPLLVALPIALVVAAIYIGATASFSVQSVLAATQARPANPNVRAEKLLMDRVEEMAIASGLPKPKVYVQDSRDINAFATGTKPENAVVCVTTGALEQLNQEELQGVLGHELSHVLNRDILLATITLGVVGTIALLAEIALRALWWGGGRRGGGRDRGGGNVVLLVIALVAIVLAPLFSRLVYLAMKRRREYLADATGVKLTRNPTGLANALHKIAGDLPDDPKGSKTAASLYIANPWAHVELDSVFSTHPPLQERIRRLKLM